MKSALSAFFLGLMARVQACMIYLDWLVDVATESLSFGRWFEKKNVFTK